MPRTASPQDKVVAEPAHLCDIDAEYWHGPYAHKHDAYTWHVPSSNGGYYAVTYDGTWNCLCPDSIYRAHLCKHSRLVIELEAQGRTDDLPEATRTRYSLRRAELLPDYS